MSSDFAPELRAHEYGPTPEDSMHRSLDDHLKHPASGEVAAVVDGTAPGVGVEETCDCNMYDWNHPASEHAPGVGLAAYAYQADMPGSMSSLPNPAPAPAPLVDAPDDVEAAHPSAIRVPLNRKANAVDPVNADLNVGIDHIDIPIVIDPDMPERGKYDYAYDGSRVIRLREWNEQVLLHEILHVVCDPLSLATPDDPYSHNIIARIEVALWETGWRLAARDADLTARAEARGAERAAKDVLRAVERGWPHDYKNAARVVAASYTRDGADGEADHG